MCPTLCQKYSTSDNKWLNILLNVVLLPLIKEGIRANNENYKEESIMLLGQLVCFKIMRIIIFSLLLFVFVLKFLNIDRSTFF